MVTIPVEFKQGFCFVMRLMSCFWFKSTDFELNVVAGQDVEIPVFPQVIYLLQ
jgi:hypothetical protein